MKDTKKEKAARYAGYERKRLDAYAPPLRVLISPGEGELLEKVRIRRGIAKGAYPAALLRAALPLESLGGDAVAVLERALAEIKAVNALPPEPGLRGPEDSERKAG